MIEVYNFHEGETALLISVPHDGCHLPTDLYERMTSSGIALPDTDWHVTELYGFARELGASMISANYSRYVVDLNRSSSDEQLYPGQIATGLCPVQTFSGDDIYKSGDVGDEEIRNRVETYWRPYHDRIRSVLESLQKQHGYALLWDAHSIASAVPRLFEGTLPALNIGTNGGRSCAMELQGAVAKVAQTSPYSSILNGRFRGGFITRHYGDPDGRVHAVQLEIAQRVYMDEASRLFDARKASRLRDTLRQLLKIFMQTANRDLSI
jgi:N-formylglutamate amidohydrolase